MSREGTISVAEQGGSSTLVCLKRLRFVPVSRTAAFRVETAATSLAAISSSYTSDRIPSRAAITTAASPLSLVAARHTIRASRLFSVIPTRLDTMATEDRSPPPPDMAKDDCTNYQGSNLDNILNEFEDSNVPRYGHCGGTSEESSTNSRSPFIVVPSSTREDMTKVTAPPEPAHQTWIT